MVAGTRSRGMLDVFGSQSRLRLLTGLGDEEVSRGLRVIWPESGRMAFSFAAIRVNGRGR